MLLDLIKETHLLLKPVNLKVGWTDLLVLGRRVENGVKFTEVIGTASMLGCGPRRDVGDNRRFGEAPPPAYYSYTMVSN